MKSLSPLIWLLCLGMAAPAAAQSGRATVYCVNNVIRIERGSMEQVRSGRGHSEICIVGPSFDFQPDGKEWARKNLGADEGGACRCR